MGGFTPYEKYNTLCISGLQNHSHIPWLGRHTRCYCNNRQAQAMPSETFRFAPSRRLSLRSCRVLATTVARPGASRSAFAPPIHMAMGGHGFREGTACACLANKHLRNSVVPNRFGINPS